MSESRVLPMQPRRYLGLELAGAKNQKTSLAVLEYYPREQKVFLLDVYDRIAGHNDQSGDEALLETITEATSYERNRTLHQAVKIGVNVPIELPPCITCERRACRTAAGCSEPAAKWMRETARKAAEASNLDVNVLEVTPYTQRPFEIWARYRILPELARDFRFEIDEALGGNRAPLTARMHYLKRHLGDLPIVEVWPKLTISPLAQAFGLPKRLIQNYRKPEEGYAARVELLETIAMKKGVFIYDRDLKKLGTSLAAFDAFICAYTAVLCDRDMTAKAPRGFPKHSSWVAYFPPAGLAGGAGRK